MPRKGYRQSRVHRDNISNGNKGKGLGRKFSEESKRKMSKSHIGRKVSEETKEKIRLSMKGKMPKYIPSTKGLRYKISKESSEKRKASGHGKWMKGRFGDKSNGWKGGVSRGENKKKYYRMKSRERRAKKMSAEGGHSVGEWETLKAQYNWTCPSCKKLEPEIKLTEDHIIPLSKGGSDNIENVQPLCKSCNCKKHTKTIKYIKI